MRDAVHGVAGAREELERARRERNRKRLVKRSVRKERKRPAPPDAATPLGNLRFNFLDGGDDVLHGASAEDIRDVLAAMPESARIGIERVQFSLGIAYHERCAVRYKWVETDKDPITGRIGSQIALGVYVGRILGRYVQRSRFIEMFGFVVDWNQVVIPKPALELYLRLRALQTFVHEVAHHHDELARTARGRWLADRQEKNEQYAEKMEYEWTNRIVTPMLEKKYAPAVKHLLDWIEEHGGFRFDLKVLAPDPRHTGRNGLYRVNWSIGDAVEEWLREWEPKDRPLDRCLRLAQELHYAEAFSECLEIVAKALQNEPENQLALLIKADTFKHLHRLDEAFSIVQGILQRNPNDLVAWELRGDILEARKDWRGLLENARELFSASPLDTSTRNAALAHQAVALCALDRVAECEAAINTLIEMRHRIAPFIRRVVFGRAGRKEQS